MDRIELEGELREWRDWEEGPTLYINGRPLLTWLDPPLEYYEWTAESDARCWADAAPVLDGRWRIIVERVEVSNDG
jgi:hypothetical protein